MDADKQVQEARRMFITAMNGVTPPTLQELADLRTEMAHVQKTIIDYYQSEKELSVSTATAASKSKKEIEEKWDMLSFYLTLFLLLACFGALLVEAIVIGSSVWSVLGYLIPFGMSFFWIEKLFHFLLGLKYKGEMEMLSRRKTECENKSIECSNRIKQTESMFKALEKEICTKEYDTRIKEEEEKRKQKTQKSLQETQNRMKISGNEFDVQVATALEQMQEALGTQTVLKNMIDKMVSDVKEMMVRNDYRTIVVPFAFRCEITGTYLNYYVGSEWAVENYRESEEARESCRHEFIIYDGLETEYKKYALQKGLLAIMTSVPVSDRWRIKEYFADEPGSQEKKQIVDDHGETTWKTVTLTITYDGPEPAHVKKPALF